MANNKERYGDEDFWELLDQMTKSKNESAPKKKVSSLPYKHPSTIAVDVTESNAVFDRSCAHEHREPTTEAHRLYSEKDLPLPRSPAPYAHLSRIGQGAPLYEYTPDSILLRRVRVFSERKRVSVTEKTMSDASTDLFSRDGIFFRERRSLLNRSGKPCTHTPYYSVSPRYTQLTAKQLSWYLWWRENTRRGEFLPTDESYVVLYISELIATEEKEKIGECLVMLCELYKIYSQGRGWVRSFLPDVICDFCLIHGISAPIEQLSECYHSIYAVSRLREFFLGMTAANRTLFTDALVDLLPVYDYRRSKFSQSDNRALFDTHIHGAIKYMLSDDPAYSALSSFSRDTFNMTTVERRPYSSLGLFRGEGIKLEVCYYDLANLRDVITNAVRHAENRLRTYLGVKTTLHILNLDEAISNSIDTYMSANLPSLPNHKKKNVPKQKKEEPIPEYERLYDSPNVALSIDEAEMIERASWQTTEKLVNAFETDVSRNEMTATGCTIPTPEKEPQIKESFPTPPLPLSIEMPLERDPTSIDEATELQKRLGDKFEFISLCLQSRSSAEQRNFARKFGLSPDGIADEINEISLEIISDILLEASDGVYTVIPDYTEFFN